MLLDIQKCSVQYLKYIFSPLDEFTDYDFWMRNHDMTKQIYSSLNYEIIWQRKEDIVYEIPLIWCDYLAQENKNAYMLQLHARHSQNYLDQEKNLVLYQVYTPNNEIRYLRDRCFRFQNKNGEQFNVGISKNITPELWQEQFINRPAYLDEQDKQAFKLYFQLLKENFGFVLLSHTQPKLPVIIDLEKFLSQPQHKPNLTKRELECLHHFCQGKTYKQTAREMTISPRTVETHLENILIKTSCSNKVEVVSRYSRYFLDTQLIVGNLSELAKSS